MAHSYTCAEFPGMEGCPFRVVARSADEVQTLTEHHARIAHDEDPDQWSPEDRQQVQVLIRHVQLTASEA